MDRIASACRADRALLDSLVEASLDEVGTDPSIPGSFLARPRRIMEDEFEGWEAPKKKDFGSPLQPARQVKRDFVSCHPLSAAIKAITGPDPAGVIQEANTSAIKLLDKAINELQDTRQKIVAGAAPAFPTIKDRVKKALDRFFHMDAGDRNIWTSKDSRGVHVLIRRLRGARQILADGWMKYTCLGPKPPATITVSRSSNKIRKPCKGSCEVDFRAIACPGYSRIVLCEPWWFDGTDFQASVLVHEALHIYFVPAKASNRALIGDDVTKGNFRNAECYAQFVLVLNGFILPAEIAASCP